MKGLWYVFKQALQTIFEENRCFVKRENRRTPALSKKKEEKKNSTCFTLDRKGGR